ncbi:MAG: AAA family ATPase, partial [Deltaproteobacteria bacterium]|nr:AAA family ATPase [Deltaproteobacteria bacterium]
MSNNLYVVATEARSGKSAIILGVMEMLLRKIDRVGFFRPIISDAKDQDHDINLISSYFDLGIPYDKMYGFTATEADDLVSLGRRTELIEGIINKYNELSDSCDFVLCEGTDFVSSAAAFEFDINAEISKNLSCPVLLVTNAHKKSTDDIVRSVEVALKSLSGKKCHTI